MYRKFILLIILLVTTVFAQDYGISKITPPGIVINNSSLQSGKFIGSPSLLIMPNGDYLASHDYFGPKIKQTNTNVFRSTDRGNTWQLISIINNQFWSNLFYLDGNIYLMGTDKEYGSVVIRRSKDGGFSWTTPTNSYNGILLDEGEYHTAPVPVVTHNGRIWRSMEERYPKKGWAENFQTFVMSAPIDSDFLKAENWETTNRLKYDVTWPGSGWLEGNIVISPQGYLWNILRNHTSKGDTAAIVKVGLTGKVITFDPDNDFIYFPGGSVKFTIRFDSKREEYFSLTNYIPERYKGGNPERTRNTLALISSYDLLEWNVEKIILEDPSVSNVGFQYADFQFEGEDLIFVSRTAYFDENGLGTSQHDSNYLTFYRIENFRDIYKKTYSR